MEDSLYWLCFKDGDSYELSPYRAENSHDALRHGMEHVLDRELVAVFSGNYGFSFEEILDLATVMPRPGSVLLRQPDADQ